MYDCAIVGGGPCGVACAIYLKQAGYNPLIIENELIGGQPLQTDNISNVVGFIGNGEEFGNILNKQIEDNHIKVIYGEASLIDNKLYVNDNLLIDTKTIVIATGAKPRTLPKINKAHYCALCDGSLYANKFVVIIGSGNSAYTESLYLNNICKEVILLQDKNHKVRANDDLQQKVSNTNIKIVKYDEIISDNGYALTISNNDDTMLILYDGIFVSIGRDQNISWIKDMDKLEIDENYNVIKDNKVLSNIFAGGDVVNKRIKQISTAINDGIIISQNIIKYLEENN